MPRSEPMSLDFNGHMLSISVVYFPTFVISHVVSIRHLIFLLGFLMIWGRLGEKHFDGFWKQRDGKVCVRIQLYFTIMKLLLQNLNKPNTDFLRLEERITSVIGSHKQNPLLNTELDDDIQFEALIMTVDQNKGKRSRNPIKIVTKEKMNLQKHILH